MTAMTDNTAASPDKTNARTATEASNITEMSPPEQEGSNGGAPENPEMSEEDYKAFLKQMMEAAEVEAPSNRAGLHLAFQRNITTVLSSGKQNALGPLCNAFSRWAEGEAHLASIE